MPHKTVDQNYFLSRIFPLHKKIDLFYVNEF